VPHEGARNEVEGLLAQVWGEVLGVEEVGVNDSFFELGGHSLLATQLISRIQALFQIELPIRTLFEAPVLADLAQEIEGILKGGKTVESLPLRPLPRNRELPLSFAQERLWFLDQLEPSNPFYNISTAMRITGPLDEGALERSLSEIVRRHESLRTTFTFDERPRQQITPERETSLPVIDLRGDPAEEQQPKVSALAHEEAQRPFDLSQGPLLRTTLLRLAEEESILLLTMHHVVSDGWSMGILIREITGLYEAFSKGRPSPLPDLHIQYADFAVWQRSWLQGSVFSRQLKYWKEQLAGLPPTLELPTDHPRPEVQTFRGAIESSVLPQSLADDLKAICRSEGVTLYMLMLAAFQVLLYRYTGQNDIAIGSPIANRNRKEVEGLIGFFINTLVMRTDLSGGPSFRQVLKRVREVTLGAYAHQDLPFEKLVEELKPVRDLSRQPLFQVMFAFQNTPTTKLEVAGLNFTGLEVDKKTVQFDWNVAMQEIDRGIILEWQYNTDLFEADTVRRMIGHLRHLLESIAARPEQPIAELELLPEAERTRLLRGLNDTAAEYRRELCVHELFEQQVERTPTAIALVSGAEELTYAELNSRANQLAHYLRERGVRADTPVGVCLERSAEMVVALLGVLKAGGCYVPLDPEYPRERLSFMLADSRVRLLLTQRRVAGALPQHAAEEVRLDADWEEIAQSPDMNLAAAAAPESLAYIIYTSGSTGRPKGVMIPRRALHNHMAWMLSRFPLTSEDAVIQKTPFSFDASVWEFYAPLLTGARLVMAEPGGHYDPEYLVQLIAAQGVTTLQVVPSLLERLLEEVEPGRCRSLRRVFCGGEALAARLVERFYERLGAELYNLYGPTEATIDATFWECAPSPARRSIPIGAPVSNTQVYVLDAEMRLVPAGVSGELYIGGESLGRGYLNRPELTAERFVPHPFSSEPGARLYKTGDVVRWNDEGELEYLGRNDEQVKVRGYRIEVGEIEASLLEREEVGQAVVLVKEEGRSKQLAAFVVPKGGEHVDAKELRGHLQGRLPEYMVPASIAVVGEMPLTPNGKIDRQALLSVKAEAAERASRYAGARNGVEELLARVWQEVLGVERIGIHDNFFELGGESILSIQVIARLRQEGLKLSLKQMFQHQTIAELARVVVSAEESSAEQFDSGDNVPLTPIQHRFFEQGLPNPHHFNQAVMLAADTRPDAVALTAVLHKLVSQHASLRLHFTPGEGEWRQAYAEAETPQLLWTVDLSHLSEDEAEQRQQLEAQAEAAQASLNITQGPLLRAVLFDLGARSGWRLLIVIHHLGVDGVSWRVLLEDLQRGYAQALAGKSVELPPPTATFRRWSQALHDYGSSERLRAEVGYWTDARRREVRRLPVDFAGGENTASSSQSVEFELGHEETRALLQEVPRVYHTQAQEALAAALALAFRKWTGETRLLVDFEGHGREEEAGEGVDVSRTVGWFTSVYPVLLEVTGEEVASALKAVKEQLRGVPGRGIGYGVLRYLSGEERVREALAGMPGAEVSLNYLGQFDRVLEGGRFRAASESVGAVQDVGGRREYLLTINALVADGRLRVSFGYSGGAHRRETIEVLGAGFVGALRGMIEHCGEEGAGGHTPSDFPLARLTQAQIDAIEVGQAGVEDIYGLSPLQQGLMFHSMYAPQSGLYVAQSSVRMRKLDKEAFQRAWQGVVDRHEILRTAFVADGLDRPVQVVLGDVPLSWHEQDLRGLSEAAVEQEINEYVEWDLAQGFDFARAPVMRLALLRVGEDEYQFVWSHHHVLLDGWSIPLLVKEVASFYEAYSRGEELELPKPRPYRDYMAWLAQQDGRAAEEFWRAQLRGVSEPTRLGIDRGAEAGVEEYGEHQVRLGEELTTKLREMGRRNQVTLNTIIQGAWALVLSRYSGETRVTFGTTVAGRPAELDGVGRMVGLFVNTVPLSVEVDEGESVISYLKQIQQKHVEIRQYEHTPLVKIQGWSEVARGVPLYENLFTFQNYPVDDKLWEQGAPKGLQVESVRTRARSHYPLAVRIAVEASMLIRMTYDRGRYSDASVKRMLGHLQYLLEEVGSDPSRRLSGLELLTPEERRMMLTGGGNASAQSA
jgi:amino acid adenylation domain-containing protein/non-ribosomal peptide synthase protein (TIGR01720 family)